MATHYTNNQNSYVYLGLAGETGRGRVVQSGLFRMADGSEEWQRLERGLPEAPAVRALAAHPRQPEIVYAGTQSGPYRSADRGAHCNAAGCHSLARLRPVPVEPAGQRSRNGTHGCGEG